MEYYDDMSKKINILIISYAFPPSNAVGAVRIGALHEFLKKKEYNVKVISSKGNGFLDKKLKKPSKGLKLSRYFRSIDRTVFSKYVFNNIKSLYSSKEEYDFVICSYKPVGNLIIGIFYKIFNKKTKLIFEFRDLMSQFGRKEKVFPLNLVDSLVDKLFVSFSDEIVVVSPASQKKAEKFYKRRVNLIFNGIDEKKNFLQKKSKPIKILYTGTLSEVRNLKIICGHIKQSGQDIELLIASKQDPKLYAGDYQFVKHIGFLSKVELEKIIRQVNFFLILEGFDKNSEENIPAKLFEYLSYNKPIIANCSPKSEIIKILDETEAGMNINHYKSFIKYINFENFKTNPSINNYLRENQFKKYIDLMKLYIKKPYK